MQTILDLNIASAEFKANPQPLYKRLRAQAPVCLVALPNKQTAWLVTRYDDALAVLKDERFVKDRLNALTPEQAARQPWVPGIFKPLARNMLDVDAPDHTRLRTLVHKAFTPRMIERMQERIQAVTDNLLDGVQSRGSMDLIRDYALPLPTTIIAEMLGVPTGEQHKFHRWSNVIVASDPSGWGMLKAIPSAFAFLRYIRRLIKTRRQNPQDDLVSALVQAEEAGETLSEDELVAMVFLLLVAGHETTVNLIGNGVLALLEHPEQLERLRSEPALIKSAVEELLRYQSPLEMATERYTREDVDISGVTIPRGELVYAVISSANRDERRFSDPDVLTLTREPNKHLSFGHGAHYCLGAPLARMEGQIAINTLLRRLPLLQAATTPEKLRWRRSPVLRGLVALPVTFARQRATA